MSSAAFNASPGNTLTLKVPSMSKVLKQDIPANVQLPYDLVVTFYEVMAFLPSMLQLPEAMLRMINNGADPPLMARVQLWARDELNQDTFLPVYNRLKKQGGDAISRSKGTTSGSLHLLEKKPQNDLTPRFWRTRNSYDVNGKNDFGHVLLRDLYRDVHDDRWPQGNNRGRLTQCLEFDRQNPELNLYTWNIPDILLQITPKEPRRPSQTYENADQEDIVAWSNSFPKGIGRPPKQEASAPRRKGKRKNRSEAVVPITEAHSRPVPAIDVVKPAESAAGRTQPQVRTGLDDGINRAGPAAGRPQPPDMASLDDGVDEAGPMATRTELQIMASLDADFQKTALIPYLDMYHVPSVDEFDTWLEDNDCDHVKLSRLHTWLASMGVGKQCAIMLAIQAACNESVRDG